MRTKEELRDAFRNEWAGLVAHALMEGYRIGCEPAELTNHKMQQCGSSTRTYLIEAQAILDRVHEFLTETGPPKKP